MKTDIAEEIGLHVWERRGLGKAPFRVVGCVERVGPLPLADGSFVGAPGQPMGCCSYCSQGIKTCYIIRSADGKEFDVGCDCVRRCGETGILKAFRNTPEQRALRRKAAQAADERVKAQVTALLTDEVKAKLDATRNPFDTKGRSYLGTFTNAWGWCGAAGRKRWLKTLKGWIAEVQS